MKSKNTAETNETFDKRKYDLQWDKQNTKRIGMKLNKHTDADIFEYLAGITNVQGYLMSADQPKKHCDTRQSRQSVL